MKRSLLSPWSCSLFSRSNMSTIAAGVSDPSPLRREPCLNHGVFFSPLKFTFRKFRWGKFNAMFEKLGSIRKGTPGVLRRAGNLDSKQGPFSPLSSSGALWQAHSGNTGFCPNLLLGSKPRHISSEVAPTEPRALLSDQIVLKTSEWT